MRKTAILIFCSFIAANCYAQEFEVFTLAQADSLKRELRVYPHEDSVRVGLLGALTNAYAVNDPIMAETYCRQALALASKIKWINGIVSSYQQLGTLAVNASNYKKALGFFQKSLSASEVLKDKTLTAHLKTNIAMIYLQTGEYNKALPLYKEAIILMHQQGEKYLESLSLLNLGLLYFRIKDFPNALRYYNETLAISYKNNYDQVSAYSLANQGAVFNQVGKFDSAIVCFKTSIQFANNVGDENIKSMDLNGLAESNIYQKNYRSAEPYLKQSLAISKPLSIIQNQKESYEIMSDIFNKQKKYKSSLEAYKIFITLRDSVLNDDKKSEITRLEMQYDFDKKEALAKAAGDKKQALATAEINKQKVIRNASIIIGSILILIAIAVIIFYKRRKDIIQKKKEAEFNTEVANTEMKALRAQMNPHFIYNSLNSINDYIDKHDTATATMYTTKFAKLMRMILENSEQKEIPIAQDLKALELYMQLEALRMSNKFTYEIKVDGDIDQENTLIPPLILQPFVENSIWHGITKKPGSGKINIYIKKEAGMINCIVEDNGAGINETEDKTMLVSSGKKSLGMKITNARIDIMNKLKNSKANVKLFNLAEGTRVEVMLPEELSF